MPKHRPISAVRLVAFLLGGLAGAAPCARAADLIYGGIQPKVEAGAGETVSRGAVALFFNPANLIFTKWIEPDLDVSYALATYTYQHTQTDQYDPVIVKVNTPLVTAGLGFRPIPSLAFGVAALPLGAGTPQTITSVPLELQSSTYQVMDITTKSTALDVAAGAAFRAGDAFTIGLGLIHGTEKTQITIVNPDTGNTFIDTLYQTAWNQYVVGVRSELIDRALVFGLSYKTAVTKVYTGDILINVDPATSDYQPYTGVGYAPATIAAGLETRFGDFGLFLDVVHAAWSGGRAIVKRGLGNDSDQLDYIDENDLTVGAKFWAGKKHMLTAAFASIGANIGDGSPEPGTTASGGLRLATAAAADPVIGGVAFGELDAIPRKIFAGGYRYKLSGTGFFELGGSYQTGSRIVPAGYAQEGTYTISVVMVSAGLAFGF